jgi:hypothetical protein
MEPKTPDDPDELLASDAMWTFIAVVDCALAGIIVWVGFVLL